MPSTRERIAADKAAAADRRAQRQELEKRNKELVAAVETLKAQNEALSASVAELTERVTALEPVKPTRTTKTAK